MVRHVVMFKFKPGISKAQRMEFAQALARLTDEIEVIRTLEVGQNFTTTPRACDIVLIVDVDDEEALKTYADHPKHQPVIQMAGELCSESRVVDYVI